MNRKARFFVKALSYAVSLFLLTSCVTSGDKGFRGNEDKVKAVLQYTELGLRYVQQGKTVEARRPLKRALEIDDKSPDVHHALAIMFQAEQDLELADQHFQKSIQFGPERTSFRNNYAAFLFSQKRFAEAAEQFREAAEDNLYDNRADVLANLGVSYLRMEQKDKALNSFERALAIDDTQSRALLEAALLEFEQGNVARSASYHKQFQKLVRLRFTSSTPRSLGLGIELARANNDKNQEASFQMMLKNLFPKSEESQRYK